MSVYLLGVAIVKGLVIRSFFIVTLLGYIDTALVIPMPSPKLVKLESDDRLPADSMLVLELFESELDRLLSTPPAMRRATSKCLIIPLFLTLQSAFTQGVSYRTPGCPGGNRGGVRSQDQEWCRGRVFALGLESFLLMVGAGANATSDQ
jgi:hypothetical protein